MPNWKALLDKTKHHLSDAIKQLKNKGQSNNKDETLSPNTQAKQQQQRHIAMVVAIGVAAVIGGLLLQHGGSKKKGAQPESVIKTTKESPFTSPVDKVDEQSVWIEKSENELNDEQKSTDTLQKMMQKQAVSVQSQSAVMNEQQQTITQLSQQLNAVEAKLAAMQTDAQAQSTNHSTLNNGGMNSSALTGMAAMTLPLTSLPAASSPAPLKTPDNYVPSGSYVEAVMLGGLDASAGVNSQSSPRPVLLRTTDTGTLPNSYHSHLKNCRIIGAGYGDLSSERAYIRLESMSCMRDGKLVDFPVYGYVSGTDGKDGVRGKVVMRDGELVAKGFIGGLASGFGDSVSDNYTTTSISPLGSTTSINNGQSLEYGAAQGVSQAADLYAQYNIKRAEQLQPVIEVSAGTVVDIVFNKGFYLDGLSEKDHQNPTQPSTANNSGLSNRFAMTSNNADMISGNMNNSNLTNQVQQITHQPLSVQNASVDNDESPQVETSPTMMSSQPLQEFP